MPVFSSSKRQRFRFAIGAALMVAAVLWWCFVVPRVGVSDDDQYLEEAVRWHRSLRWQQQGNHSEGRGELGPAALVELALGEVHAVGSCAVHSAAHSDIRVCLDVLMPMCRSWTGCPAPLLPPNQTNPVSTTDNASVEVVNRTGLLEVVATRRVRDRRRTRLHYFCDERDHIRQWNLTFRTVHEMCSRWDDASEMVVARDKAANRSGYRISSLSNSAQTTSKYEALLLQLDTERQWLASNCSEWRALASVLRTDAVDSLKNKMIRRIEPHREVTVNTEERIWNAHRSRITSKRNVTNGSFRSEVMAHVAALVREHGMNVSGAVPLPQAIHATLSEVQWLWCRRFIALYWADRLHHLHLPEAGGHDTTTSTWAADDNDALLHDMMLHGWLAHHDMIGDREGFARLAREAYSRFRAELLRQKQQMLAATTVAPTASTDSPPPMTPTPTVLTESGDAVDNPEGMSMTDMLFADASQHEGCDSRWFPEVRIAFVGDSISMAYPRRLVQWFRQQCSGCSNASLKVHLYNFAVSAKQIVDEPRGFRRTPMYVKSVRYQPDVTVFMLGTNDGLRWWYLNVMRFEETLEEMLLTYLQRSGDSPSHVIVLTPSPVFDSVYANHTQVSTRKRRGKTYERRVGYANGPSSRMVGRVIRPAILRVVERLRSRDPGGAGQRLHLVDFYDTVLRWLWRHAATYAVEIAALLSSGGGARSLLVEKPDEMPFGMLRFMKRRRAPSSPQRNSNSSNEHPRTSDGDETSVGGGDVVWERSEIAWRELIRADAQLGSVAVRQRAPRGGVSARDVEDVVLHFSSERSPQIDNRVDGHLGGLPLLTKAVQRAIFTGISDGVHLEKPLQKVLATEVLRHMFFVNVTAPHL